MRSIPLSRFVLGALVAGAAFALVVLLLVLVPVKNSYNTIQEKDQDVKAKWSQVLNVYKRRADLVPNLVATVKGYAAHEQQVLTQVAEARARVGAINVDADDPQSLETFRQAQGQLQSAIGRLLVVSENYPQLKADAGFRDLQAQLEGSENRIAVERRRYIEAVQDYNTYIRSFPQNLVAKFFEYGEKRNFAVENEAQIQDAPTVDFSPAPNPAPAQ